MASICSGVTAFELKSKVKRSGETLDPCWEASGEMTFVYSPVEEVGGGVVSLNRGAALTIDCQIYGVANCRNITFDLVSDRGADLLGAGDGGTY